MKLAAGLSLGLVFFDSPPDNGGGGLKLMGTAFIVPRAIDSPPTTGGAD